MASGRDDEIHFRLPDERRPVQELIEGRLRDLIASGDLKPGQRLPNESELAAEMGVARGSVRSALQTLKVKRIVEVRRGLGWFVSHAPAVDADAELNILHRLEPSTTELLELRIGIEGAATRFAALRASDEDLYQLDLLGDAHRSAGRDVDLLVRTDEAFHAAIVNMSGNRLYTTVYRSLIPELGACRAKVFAQDPAAAERSFNAHDSILSFLQQRDARGAHTAMLSHLMELHSRFADRPISLKDFI